jgi:hypothetical protein
MELKTLYTLWRELVCVPTEGVNQPMQPKAAGDVIKEEFLGFPAGTPVEDVWRWFERQNPNFVLGEVMEGKFRDLEDPRRIAEDAEHPAVIAARQMYESDNIEIDDHPPVTNGGDPGFWVQGWLWVPKDDLSKEDWSNLAPWVIYHASEQEDARFWSVDDGWTNLEGATRFAEMPTAPYPFGGPENTQAGALCIGTMQPYTVTLAESPMATAFDFECFADDEDHAVEQAENAYPGHRVQSVRLTEEGHVFG